MLRKRYSVKSFRIGWDKTTRFLSANTGNYYEWNDPGLFHSDAVAALWLSDCSLQSHVAWCEASQLIGDQIASPSLNADLLFW